MKKQKLPITNNDQVEKYRTSSGPETWGFVLHDNESDKRKFDLEERLREPAE